MGEVRINGHWLQFWLRALLALVSLLAVGLGWQYYSVYQRRAARDWVERNGGTVDVYAPSPPSERVEISPGVDLVITFGSGQRIHGPKDAPEIPQWKRWLGDEAYNQILLPEGSSPADVVRMRELFPEATVEVNQPPAGGSGFF
jgi:hypothetical protein